MLFTRYSALSVRSLGVLSVVLFIGVLQAQKPLPVLKANDPNLSIRDGMTFMEDYWTVSPDIALDVYEANRSSETKTVVFYSDLDSLTFELIPGQFHDFLVVVNKSDTCLNRIQSDVFTLTTRVLKSDTIPFELTEHNNIVIQAILNERDTLRLMFHTDAGAIALTDKAIQKIEELSFDDSVKAKSWGGIHSMGYSLGNSLAMGFLNWDSLAIWQDKNSGHGTDGKFGPHLFADKVIEVNYDKRLLIIHSKLPMLSSDFQKLPIHFNRGTMYIDGLLQLGDQQVSHRFDIHSGYSGALLVDDDFANRHALSEHLEIISQSELKDSFGNTLVTKDAILPAFSIGDFTFQSVPLGFFEGKVGNRHISVFGADLLRRFNVVFDLQQAYIYLQPSEDFVIAFEE